VINPESTSETPPNEFYFLLSCLCESAGGKFRGLQAGFQAKDRYIQPLVLFDDLSAPWFQRSTMAVPLNEISTDRVRQAIARKRAEWNAR
jgi:hypothetical protein